MGDMRRALRVAKYGLAAPVLARLISSTPLLDGHDGAPPSWINYAGGGDFHEVGRFQRDVIVQRTGLAPGERVLDLGSGIGRLAMALHREGPKIRYDGLEIVRYGVEWCRKTFREAPDFRFHHADIHNSFYNPFGRTPAQEFRFPFADASLDLVFATSVFSHLMPNTTRHYLSEIARVLVPGGRAYFTYFRADASRGAGAAFSFSEMSDGAAVESKAEPELAVAYQRAQLTEWAEAHGLVCDADWPGNWAALEGHDFQDAILLGKGQGQA